MSIIKGTNILLGISAGIAAYKSPQIVRKLKELGANVQVVLSKNADEFVTKVTKEFRKQNLLLDHFAGFQEWMMQ